MQAAPAQAGGENAGSCLFFLFFKIPPSTPGLPSQAVWAVFVFQGLSAPPCPQYHRDLQEQLDKTVPQRQQSPKDTKAFR